MISGRSYYIPRNRMPNPRRFFKDARKKQRPPTLTSGVIEHITFILSTVGDQTNKPEKADDDRIHHNVQRPSNNANVPAAPHNTTSYIMSSRESFSPTRESAAPFANFDEYGSMKGVLQPRTPAAREGTGDTEMADDGLERITDPTPNSVVPQGDGHSHGSRALRSLQLRVSCQDGRIADLVGDSEGLRERLVSLEQELAAFRRRVCVLELSGGGVGLVEVVACSCN